MKNIKELLDQASRMEATLINLKEAFQALCKIIIDMEIGINEVRRLGEEYKIKKIKGGGHETRRSWHQP
jgi:metal-sulfur cluster biosynthetic enzyme